MIHILEDEFAYARLERHDRKIAQESYLIAYKINDNEYRIIKSRWGHQYTNGSIISNQNLLSLIDETFKNMTIKMPYFKNREDIIHVDENDVVTPVFPKNDNIKNKAMEIWEKHIPICSKRVIIEEQL